MGKIITVRDFLEDGGKWKMIPDFNKGVTHIEVRSKNNHAGYDFDVEGIVDPMDDWRIAKILDTPLTKRRDIKFFLMRRNKMRLSEFNASLPKKEEIERDCLKEELEICRKENLELRNTIKHLLDYIKEEK